MCPRASGSANLGNIASQSVQLISKIATALTLYFGARLVIDGSLSVGELVAFNMLAGRVSQPVLRLAQVWQDFQQARLSIARLGDILNTPAEPTYNTSRSTIPAVTGAIKFEHVTFRYRVDGSEILHDVNFEVSPGQIVGIVGPSGSGKSTVAKLVQRLVCAGKRKSHRRRCRPGAGRSGMASTAGWRRASGERAFQRHGA